MQYCLKYKIFSLGLTLPELLVLRSAKEELSQEIRKVYPIWTHGPGVGVVKGPRRQRVVKGDS